MWELDAVVMDGGRCFNKPVLIHFWIVFSTSVRSHNVSIVSNVKW